MATVDNTVVITLASKKTSIGLVLIIVFAFSAVIGDRSIGINSECNDFDNGNAIDNDGDGQFNHQDPSCIQYPYADGNGESDTQPFEQNQGDKYLGGNSWDYWYQWFLDNGYSPIGYCNQPNPYDPVFQPEAHQSFANFQASPECPP